MRNCKMLTTGIGKRAKPLKFSCNSFFYGKLDNTNNSQTGMLKKHLIGI